MFTTYGEGLDSLNLTGVSITARDCLPYRGKIKWIKLTDVRISDSGRKWFAESGVFESPALKDLCLNLDDADTATFVVSHIKLPNLIYLEIRGQAFDNEESVRELVSLFNRTPSMIRVSFYGIFNINAASIVNNLRTLPALLEVNISLCNEFANLILQWALSDENVSVGRVLLRPCTGLEDVSPNEFFLHPCLAFIDCITEHIDMYNAMHAAKPRTVHFAHMVRNNKAMMRLPTELVRMVFEMYDRWEEVFKS
jgi:hypothetical protein